ncbi:MAG: heparin lyase I family protein [Thermodesulfovibrionales bacterium]
MVGPGFLSKNMSPVKQRSSRRDPFLLSVALTLALVLSACGGSSTPDNQPVARRFQTGFEAVDDFQGYYIVPQDHMGSASHDLSSAEIHSGRYSHKGWIYAANPPSTSTHNNNHRAYPTIQLYKTAGGAFKTPVFIEFWVWLDVNLSPGEWFSFATLDHTTSDSWDAVLVNLSDQGFVHLMHVPYSGQGERTFQTSTLRFPMKQWVKLSIVLHFDREHGYAMVWQDDQLVSRAEVKRGGGFLTQAHFGLYAPPSLSGGVIYNDDLVIKEEQGE